MQRACGHALVPIHFLKHVGLQATMSESLGPTQIFAATLLSKGCGNLGNLFSVRFSLVRWQQAPVAAMMMEYEGLVSQIVEVIKGAERGKQKT